MTEVVGKFRNIITAEDQTSGGTRSAVSNLDSVTNATKRLSKESLTMSQIIANARREQEAGKSAITGFNGATNTFASSTDKAATAQKGLLVTSKTLNSKLGPLGAAISGVGFAFGSASGKIGQTASALAGFAATGAAGGPLLLGLALAASAVGLLVSKFSEMEDAAAKAQEAAKKLATDNFNRLQTELENSKIALRDFARTSQEVAVVMAAQEKADADRKLKTTSNMIRIQEAILNEQMIAYGKALDGSQQELDAIQEQMTLAQMEITRLTNVQTVAISTQLVATEDLANKRDLLAASMIEFGDEGEKAGKKTTKSMVSIGKTINEMVSKLGSGSGLAKMLSDVEALGESLGGGFLGSDVGFTRVKSMADAIAALAAEQERLLNIQDAQTDAINHFDEAIVKAGGSMFGFLQLMKQASDEPLELVSTARAQNAVSPETDAAISGAVQNFGNSIKESLKQAAMAFISPIKDAILSIPSQLMGIIMGSEAEGPFDNFAENALNAVVGIFTDPDKGIMAMLTNVGMLFEDSIKIMMAHLPEILKKVTDVFMIIFMTLVKVIPDLVNVIVPAVGYLLTEIINALPEIIKQVIGGVGQIAALLVGVYPIIVSLVVQILMMLVETILNPSFWKAIVVAFKDGFKNAMHEIGVGIKDNMRNAADNFRHLWGTVWNAIIGGLLKIIPDVFKRTRAWLRGLMFDDAGFVGAQTGIGTDNRSFAQTQEEDGAGGAGGGSGLGGAMMTSREGIPSFDVGGMVRDFGSGIRGASGGTIIEAHAGEAVLTRNAVQRLGGESAVNAINSGSGGGQQVNMYFLTKEAAIQFYREHLQQIASKDAEFNFMAANGLVVR